MTAYESDPGTEPVQIVTMRRIRKQQKLGQTGTEELGEPLLADLFLNTTPTNNTSSRMADTTRKP